MCVLYTRARARTHLVHQLLDLVEEGGEEEEEGEDRDSEELHEVGLAWSNQIGHGTNRYGQHRLRIGILTCKCNHLPLARQMSCWWGAP